MQKTTHVVERLISFNKHRDPALLRLKYERMRQNSFAFLRGTCHLFYEDWPANSPLNDAPRTWICGDLHPDNFGSYKGENGLAYFDINDFDEAVLAPCTWDVVRFATAVFVSVPLVNITPVQASIFNDLFLRTYASHLADGSIRTVERGAATGLVEELLESLKGRSRKDFLDAHTHLKGGKRRLVVDGTHCLEVDDSARSKVTRIIEGLGKRGDNADFFKVLDVGHRIAGTGSLGIDRYMVLVEGDGSPDANYVLDLKQEVPSSLEPYLKIKQPEWTSPAERVLAIQKRFQGTPPALLSTVALDGVGYLLSEYQPFKDRIDLAACKGKLSRLEKLIESEASILAWGQLRSGGRQNSAIADELIAFGNSSGWKAPLLDYAEKYAATVESYFQEFADAYDKGKFK